MEAVGPDLPLDQGLGPPAGDLEGDAQPGYTLPAEAVVKTPSRYAEKNKKVVPKNWGIRLDIQTFISNVFIVPLTDDEFAREQKEALVPENLPCLIPPRIPRPYTESWTARRSSTTVW